MHLLKPGLRDNPYAMQIEKVLPRILALGDTDTLSPTYGLMDRQYWAWKLIDFPNATFQGAVNGLSVLLEDGHLAEEAQTRAILSRITAMFAGVGRITRRDGSLEEAMPFERSYCVTALVAFDMLKALEQKKVAAHLKDHFNAPAMIAPLISFLIGSDESHGMISNHLATAAAALHLWHAREGDNAAKAKGDALIARILERQSPEGWFVEYGGADPGYQTLCLSHLVETAHITDSDELWQAMGRSLEFLNYFVHPDGSLGGLYASRNTRVYYPAGIAALAERFPLAYAINRRMQASITASTTVPLAAIDGPNLMPLFNNYCAALREKEHTDSSKTIATSSPGNFRKEFKHAGIVVDKGARHYTIASTRKGGVVYHWRQAETVVIDAGLVVEDERGRRFTSQSDATDNEVIIEGNAISIKGELRLYNHPLPDAFRFLILRTLSLTVMRVPPLNALIKKLLASFLMRPHKTSAGAFQRTITLGEALSISDEWTNQNLRRLTIESPFSVIHMASQGYWQEQDDMTSTHQESSS